VVSKYYCNTIPITCSRVLNSSLGRLYLGGLGYESPKVGPATGCSEVNIRRAAFDTITEGWQMC